MKSYTKYITYGITPAGLSTGEIKGIRYSETDAEIMTIPNAPKNRHYIQMMDEVAEGIAEIVEQDETRYPDYGELRRRAYGPIGEQQDMQYWDSVNGTTEWLDHIAAVKATYPKDE
jgi:hypothetical protein